MSRFLLIDAPMIDTHCHLTDARLGAQLDDVLARARSNKVTRLITIGTGVDDSRDALKIAQSHDFIFCSAGVHPNYSHQSTNDAIENIRELANQSKVVAIGEAGLDYHYDVDRTIQRRFFEQQIALEAEIEKPMVIHCREAVDDCLAMMNGVKRAVFHCFTGSPAEAEKILAAGFWLGFTGAVTFKKNDALREAAALVPRDRLLVETDAPYLSPEPMRKQKTNEPALVVHVAQVIARIWNVEINEVDRVTTSNAERFFALPASAV